MTLFCLFKNGDIFTSDIEILPELFHLQTNDLSIPFKFFKRLLSCICVNSPYSKQRRRILVPEHANSADPPEYSPFGVFKIIRQRLGSIQDLFWNVPLCQVIVFS